MLLLWRPFLSLAVVIPVYNDSACLSHSIKAILSGTRVPDELIVIDDASTDSSGEVAEQLGVRVRLPVMGNCPCEFGEEDWASIRVRFPVLTAFVARLVTFTEPV